MVYRSPKTRQRGVYMLTPYKDHHLAATSKNLAEEVNARLERKRRADERKERWKKVEAWFQECHPAIGVVLIIVGGLILTTHGVRCVIQYETARDHRRAEQCLAFCRMEDPQVTSAKGEEMDGTYASVQGAPKRVRNRAPTTTLFRCGCFKRGKSWETYMVPN